MHDAFPYPPNIDSNKPPLKPQTCRLDLNLYLCYDCYRYFNSESSAASSSYNRYVYAMLSLLKVIATIQGSCAMAGYGTCCSDGTSCQGSASLDTCYCDARCQIYKDCCSDACMQGINADIFSSFQQETYGVGRQTRLHYNGA